MIDLATLFQAAADEHSTADFPGFPVSRKAKPERQVIDNKDISGISGVSGPSEFPDEIEQENITQAQARMRAGERARGSYVGGPETPEIPEKRVPAGNYLSGSLSLNPEKKRETGKATPLPAPFAGLEPPTFDERAAFLEYECGLSRAVAEVQARSEIRKAETELLAPIPQAPPKASPPHAPSVDGLALWRAGLARLSPERVPCPGYCSDEWARVYTLAQAFLDTFGEQAEALGWTSVRLFGVHPVAGIVRVDACGGLVLGVGGPVRAITGTEIRFRPSDPLLEAAQGRGHPNLGVRPVIAAADQFGPWAPGLDAAEQRARLRALRQTARLLAGPRADGLCRLLAQAETEPAALEPASHALNTLAATDRRQILASYAALARAVA